MVRHLFRPCTYLVHSMCAVRAVLPNLMLTRTGAHTISPHMLGDLLLQDMMSPLKSLPHPMSPGAPQGGPY